MFTKLIRKPKGSKTSSTTGEYEAPPAAGTMAAPSETRITSGIVPASSCNRCGIDHRAKDCPLKQESGIQSVPSCTGLESFPALRDVPAADRPLLFRKKVKLCTIVYDFSDALKSVKEKEIKKHTLLELVDYLATAGTAKLTDAILEDMFIMISANIFRSLPVPEHEPELGGDVYDAEEEEPILDPAWQHIQYVYEFLLRYLVHQETDPRIAKRYVDHSFVIKLLELFDSEDPREREYLKAILHRIYGKFMVLRPFIRKAISNTFYHFIFETEKHNGIGEMLEILGSIINGFALPLKEEHKLFLVRALIPLHKPKCMAMYQQQLIYCVIQYVEKDFKLADIVIRGLLKYWPLTNSQKEVIMLGEIEEVLEITQPAEFQKCMVILFRQISRSLNSPHFQVAERALMLWNSDHIVSLITQNRRVILPLIFSALEKNSMSHWNQVVHRLMQNVRKLFQDLDPELFDECLKAHQDQESKAKALEDQRNETWKRLEAAAAAKALSVGLITVT
ncbi:hypothetical protein KP509_38G055300 [Ceratopteris richardii]|uniref:Serine/threonine protein phosphatase 2A regulatory subunit n=1 Tax=Ceratopteris richardii TaxID=49495 RepID=A0A8T2Q4Z9_CERRI|nr:hypothetical protein KP509_38G055300 [Ceratopteris richardii]KAH7278769.1 hypothetical protein KP509_38G055300 [Ceratopteris richardii]